MLFNSLEFLIFFPLVTALYFNLPLRGRQWLLVIASTIFYMAFIPAYALILYATIVVDFAAGVMIERSTGNRRKLFLILSLVANIGALAVFKYCNFLVGNANDLLAIVHSAARVPFVEVTLPVGLSFHTFQAMSYTIEVYRGNQRAESDFLIYALYVMFYPQLVAGPIERPQHILHQLKLLHPFVEARVVNGFRRMLWGFFKKAVVADRLALIVNLVYARPERYPGPVLAFATAAFAFQIYADFSGYSDIALGAAEVMGVKLMTNFRQPYLSKSISEFWARWHISLSSWFRDYLYIPLGGNRVGPFRHKLNLMITFLVSGLWHGANWTYVVWGGLNGVLLVGEGYLPHVRARSVGLRGAVRTVVVFILVCITWVFFRAASIHDAFVIFRRLPVGAHLLLHPALLVSQLGGLAIDTKRLFLTIAATSVMCLVDWLGAKRGGDPIDLVVALPRTARWATYFALTMALILMGTYGRQQFIYFQF